MNASRDQAKSQFPRSACGRIGCIAIYKTENCHICDAVDTYLKEIVRSEGLSENSINIIHETSVSEFPKFDEVSSIPAVRVCETVITGIPDDEKMRDSLRTASNKKCFLEDVT